MNEEFGESLEMAELEILEMVSLEMRLGFWLQMFIFWSTAAGEDVFSWAQGLLIWWVASVVQEAMLVALRS